MSDYQRYKFDISTDTGVKTTQSGDTGHNVFGEIRQLVWNPTANDTGAGLYIALIPRMGDTGDGFQVVNYTKGLNANWVRFPTAQTSHSDGLDTGSSTDEYFVGAGDRLRIKITPGQNLCAGRLYVYVKK
jgi:hypothetical protein